MGLEDWHYLVICILVISITTSQGVFDYTRWMVEGTLPGWKSVRSCGMGKIENFWQKWPGNSGNSRLKSSQILALANRSPEKGTGRVPESLRMAQWTLEARPSLICSGRWLAISNPPAFGADAVAGLISSGGSPKDGPPAPTLRLGSMLFGLLTVGYAKGFKFCWQSPEAGIKTLVRIPFANHPERWFSHF